MISVDRIAEKMQTIKDRDMVNSEKTWAQMHKDREEKNLKEQAELAEFNTKEPQLLDQAKIWHGHRFSYFDSIFDRLEQPLIQIRNTYFPGPRIVTAEAYSFLYHQDKPNLYHKTAIIFTPSYRSAVTLHAIAEEKPKREFILFGPKIEFPNLKPELSVFIKEHHCFSLQNDWILIVDRAKRRKEDFAPVMREGEIFRRYTDFSTYFSSRFQTYTGSPLNIHTSNSLSDEWIPFKDGSETFEKVEDKLAEILTHSFA